MNQQSDPASPTPRVSVIIPNYNHAAYLQERIDSVLQQTWRDFEVILMDDASTDDSRRVLAAYEHLPNVRTLYNETNSGCVFRQWNKAVAQCRGEYIWIAESDDKSDERFLERVVGMMEANPQCGLGCCESWLLVRPGRSLRGNREPHYRPEPRRRHWTNDFVEDGRSICIHDMLHGNAMPNTSALVFRRSLFNAVGGADESMRLCGDWLLWTRMLLQTHLAHVGDRLNFYRCHTAAVRTQHRSSPQTFAEVFRIMQCITENIDVPADQLERALDGRTRRFLEEARWQSFNRNQRDEVLQVLQQIDPHMRQRMVKQWLRWRAGAVRRRMRGMLSHPLQWRPTASRVPVREG